MNFADNLGRQIPTTSNIERVLNEYPEKVADALSEWRKATLERERIEAQLYLQFKAGSQKITVNELEAMVSANDARYKAVIYEIGKERNYVALNETLLASKKEASLRTAF